MKLTLPRLQVVLMFLLAATFAAPASAGPDLAGTVLIEEPNGFAGVCDQPCYRVSKSYEYWLPTNPDNPLPLAGNNTYIYKLTHDGGTGTPLGFIPAVTAFEVAVDTAFVTAAGVIDSSPGVAPSATTVDTTYGIVSWDFLTEPVATLEATQLLYIHSPLLPGTVGDNMLSFDAQASLAATGTTVGPFLEPVQQCNLQVEVEGCVVQPPDVIGDACEGRVTSMVLEYTGGGCSASSHLQNRRKTACWGGADGESPVDILVGGEFRRRWSWDWHWWGEKRRKKRVFAIESDVAVGDTFVVAPESGGHPTVGKSVFVKIGRSGGHSEIIEFDKFHTSCSEPLGPGMQFGSMRVVSLTSTGGGTVTLPSDPDDECITDIDTLSPPHCLGKVRSLHLRYVGGDCNQTMNTQASWKVGCSDLGSPSANPVRVVIADGKTPPPHSRAYLDESAVVGGDVLDILPSFCGKDILTHATGFWVYDGVTDEMLQAGYFHTSCSQPLNLGDRFGAFQVFGIRTTDGGEVALADDVDYTVVVSNPNDETVDNVALEDDVFGPLGSGISLAPGESQSIVNRFSVETTTTNTVTATGDVAGLVCEPASASATIGVTEPPDEPQICTKKIAAVLLQYTGPAVADATVEFKAKSFRRHPVVYTGVDLAPGTILSLPAENGYTIDGTAHGEAALGKTLRIRIDGVEEKLQTDCDVPFQVGAPAPLHDPRGDPSALWSVLDFTEKHRPGRY